MNRNNNRIGVQVEIGDTPIYVPLSYLPDLDPPTVGGPGLTTIDATWEHGMREARDLGWDQGVRVGYTFDRVAEAIEADERAYQTGDRRDRYRAAELAAAIGLYDDQVLIGFDRGHATGYGALIPD